MISNTATLHSSDSSDRVHACQSASLHLQPQSDLVESAVQLLEDIVTPQKQHSAVPIMDLGHPGNHTVVQHLTGAQTYGIPC